MQRALFAFLVALSSAAFTSDFSEITHKDLSVAITAKSVIVIDVNGSKSYATGRIPGAIDFEAKTTDLAKALPADKTSLIVVYCGSPECVAWKQAAIAVTDLGYTNVRHYKGGLSGWKEATSPVERK
jgi:rhodanese-related sulfurtransferase